MPAALFENSSNVCYNQKKYLVIASFENNGEYTYFLRSIENESIEKNIPESEIMVCPVEDVIQSFWDLFEYTGDNTLAAEYVLNNIVRKCSRLSGVTYGPNNDNTQYILKINNGANYWTKNII